MEMNINRMIYTNARVDKGEGWRTLKKSKDFSDADEAAFKKMCSESLSSLSVSSKSRRVFFAKKFGKSLYIAFGASQESDTYGRPGGWIFYCCLCKPFTNNLADALPFSRYLFDDSCSWLNQKELTIIEIENYKLDTILQNAKVKSDDFWQELRSVVEFLEKELRFKHKRAKSYLFPSLTSEAFDVCRSSENTNNNLSQKHQSLGMKLAVICGVFSFSLIIGGTVYIHDLKMEHIRVIASKDKILEDHQRKLKDEYIMELEVIMRDHRQEKNSLLQQLANQYNEMSRLRSENERFTLEIRQTSSIQQATSPAISDRIVELEKEISQLRYQLDRKDRLVTNFIQSWTEPFPPQLEVVD